MKNFLLFVITLISVSCTETNISLEFENNSKIVFYEEDDFFKLKIVSEEGTYLSEVKPVRVEILDGENAKTIYSYYTSVSESNGIVTANANMEVAGVNILIADVWNVENNAPRLHRKLKIEGNSDKAFLSAIEFNFTGYTRNETEYFVPGMIYGSTVNLTPSAIGGQDLYTKGNGSLWIREDRMPAPLMAFRFDSGNSFSVLDVKPDGRTTLEDAHDVEMKTLVDEDLRFGSLFAEQKDTVLKVGYAFPGSEGEFTYQGNTYPGGQHHKWRKRYHPLKDGITQEYLLNFNFDNYSDFQSFYSSEWQKAFAILKPEVNHQDIELARETMLAVIPDILIRKSNKTGLSNWHNATDPTDKIIDNKAVFGFTGKNLEMAYYLLVNENLNPEYSKIAYLIVQSFLDLKVNPPTGEGYYFENGKPALALPPHNQIYLRSYGDAMKVLAKAYLFEKAKGIDNKHWLKWMTDFGDWVLTQQYPEGGFPRAWEPGTGKVTAKSPASSYNMIPYFCEMYKITLDERWLNASIKTGEYSWKSGHKDGRFIGGTIDNPDVLDKEAGTLSLEAYLELYEATKDSKWLDRAEVASQFAETWIYVWNVLMVKEDNEKEWANGVSTVGVQLISTGHSLVDNFMAFNVDEFVKLYKYTGKQHYLDVAKILLHNTKGMLAIPNRLFQYRGVGWIQEHWSLAPPRGKGLIPAWLPWVTTSNLNGICETEIFDEELYSKLCKQNETGSEVILKRKMVKKSSANK